MVQCWIQRECRRPTAVGVIGVALAVTGMLPAAAADPEAAIATAIEQLGDEQFAAREAASQQLAALGAAAVEPLVAAAVAGDPERALRAVDILRQFLARDEDDLAAAAEAGLEQLAGKDDLAIAQRAEVALDFHDATQAVSARTMLEQLGATFDEAGPLGLRVEIDENWRRQPGPAATGSAAAAHLRELSRRAAG